MITPLRRTKGEVEWAVIAFWAAVALVLMSFAQCEIKFNHENAETERFQIQQKAHQQDQKK